MKWKPILIKIKALIGRHPCLRKPGSETGYDGWKISIKYKLGNYRSKLRQADCIEVSNKKKRSCEDDGAGPSLKRAKRGEINHVPDIQKTIVMILWRMKDWLWLRSVRRRTRMLHSSDKRWSWLSPWSARRSWSCILWCQRFWDGGLLCFARQRKAVEPRMYYVVFYNFVFFKRVELLYVLITMPTMTFFIEDFNFQFTFFNRLGKNFIASQKRT